MNYQNYFRLNLNSDIIFIAKVNVVFIKSKYRVTIASSIYTKKIIAINLLRELT